MAILATGNINNLGLPAAIGGSNCSTLKGCGPNQDSKRTDASGSHPPDDHQGHQTSFEQSLHSTIKEHNSRASEQTGNAPSAKAGKREKEKLGLLPAQYQPHVTVIGPVDHLSSIGSEASDNGQDAQDKVQDDANIESAIPQLANAIATTAVPITPIPNTRVANDVPAGSAEAVTTPDAVNGAARPAAIASTQGIGAVTSQDTVAFEGILQETRKPAIPQRQAPISTQAPAPITAATAISTPRQLASIDIKGAGSVVPSNFSSANPAEMKPSVHMPVSGSATPTVDNSRPTISEPKLALQAAISNSKISVAPEGNSPQSHSQPAHQNDPATPVSALAGNLDKSGEGGFNQSRENSSTFQQDPKRSFAAPSPASLHQADAVMPTFAAVDSNAVISNGSPANNAQNPLSKSAILPIDQQAEKSQPSMKTDLNVRIQGQSGENINLRISERAGDIQISVRSSDQTTAAALRHELPSIQAGLERAGWHMENGGMAQSGQDNHEPGRGSQNPDKNRDQNHQAGDWQDRNQRRKDSSANAWFELDQ